MKKILAFVFVAGMVSFAACTSKPTETVEETTVEETIVEPVPAEADTVATDSGQDTNATN